MSETDKTKSQPTTNDEATAKRLAHELDFLKEEFDLELKQVNLLLVAHAVGLVTCMTLLKDYKDTPQLKGIGIFIFLFATGLMSAGLAHVSLCLYRSATIQVLKGNTTRQKRITSNLNSALIESSLSGLLLVAAILIMIWRFVPL